MGKQAKIRQERRAEQARENDRIGKVVELFDQCSPDIIYGLFKVNSCLNASRVAIEVLAHFGVKAAPTPVRALAFNAMGWAAHLLKGKVSHEEYVAACSADGVWSVALGYRPAEIRADISPNDSPDDWWGHLTVVTSNGMLIDASARQMARPALGIKVPDVVVMPVDQGFLNNQGFMVGNSIDGTVLCYQRSNADYGQIGFLRSPHNLAAADLIIDQMKRRMQREDPAPKPTEA